MRLCLAEILLHAQISQCGASDYILFVEFLQVEHLEISNRLRVSQSLFDPQ